MIYDKTGESLIDAYDVSGEVLLGAYDISGEEVYPDENPIDKYKNYEITALPYSSYGGLQGFAYHAEKLVMGVGDNQLKICNADTGARLPSGITSPTISVAIGHCNSLVFSDEFYVETDTFPLLCAAYPNPSLSYYRIANTMDTAELIKNYLLEATSKPNTTIYGFGFDNGYFYAIGYTDGSYQYSSTNQIILMKYDLQNPIDNGDNTYTLPLIYEVKRDWFECIQGSVVYDGIFWVTSGFTNPGHVFAIDLRTAQILLDIPMEDYSPKEIEGCAWRNDYTLIVGTRNGDGYTGMYKITFPDLEPISYEE